MNLQHLGGTYEIDWQNENMDALRQMARTEKNPQWKRERQRIVDENDAYIERLLSLVVDPELLTKGEIGFPTIAKALMHLKETDPQCFDIARQGSESNWGPNHNYKSRYNRANDYEIDVDGFLLIYSDGSTCVTRFKGMDDKGHMKWGEYTEGRHDTYLPDDFQTNPLSWDAVSDEETMPRAGFSIIYPSAAVETEERLTTYETELTVGGRRGLYGYRNDRRQRFGGLSNTRFPEVWLSKGKPTLKVLAGRPNETRTGRRDNWDLFFQSGQPIHVNTEALKASTLKIADGETVLIETVVGDLAVIGRGAIEFPVDSLNFDMSQYLGQILTITVELDDN